MKVIKSEVDGGVSNHIVEATDDELAAMFAAPDANVWIANNPNVEYITEYPIEDV